MRSRSKSQSIGFKLICISHHSLAANPSVETNYIIGEPLVGLNCFAQLNERARSPFRILRFKPGDKDRFHVGPVGPTPSNKLRFEIWGRNTECHVPGLESREISFKVVVVVRYRDGNLNIHHARSPR